MNIVTWNVNSLKARAPFVEWYLDHAEPDVLCIQELKLDADSVPRELFESRGYELAIHGQKQWNGVAIASKLPITDVEYGFSGEEEQARLIAATVGGIRIVDVYCPQGQRADSPKFEYKLRFYGALVEWLKERVRPTEPFILTGDMNIAPLECDVWDPAAFENVPSFHPLEHAEWARLLELGLDDVVFPHITPGTFSFWDYRGGNFHKGLGMRIDHVLATPPVRERVKTAWVDRDARKKKLGHKASDHAPVGVTLSAA